MNTENGVNVGWSTDHFRWHRSRAIKHQQPVAFVACKFVQILSHAHQGHISVLMIRDVLFLVQLELDVAVCAMHVIPAPLRVGWPMHGRVFHQNWPLQR